MSNLKKLAISSTSILLCLIVCYLCGSFISQKFNPADWSIDGRVLYLFASFASGLILGAFIYFEL